jgi:signal transduction histidine kinase
VRAWKREGSLAPLVTEIALAFAVALTSFVIVAVTFDALEATALVIAAVVVYGAAIFWIAHTWGVAYGVPVAMAAVLAYDWFQVPPTHQLEIPDTANLEELLVFFALSVLVGETAAYASQRAHVSEEARDKLLDEQAALRRVATLVAQEAPPPEVFTAVTEEVVRLLDVDDAAMFRYDDDGEATYVTASGRAGELFPVGTRIPVGGDNIASQVFRTGQPARIEDYGDASGGIGERARAIGVRGSVGCPILVDGRLWGVVVAASRSDAALPAGTELRLGEFAELLATAISNVEARTEVGRLADEQAALRRVATLVAREAPATEVFAAVAEEVAGLLEVNEGRLIRYEADNTGTIVADWGIKARRLVGARLTTDGINVAALVRRTGRAARVDNYDTTATGAMSQDPRTRGLRCSVGAPVVVEGAVWGTLTVGSSYSYSLPPDTESRMTQFAELVGTAIANMQARADLAASRARIVAAGDAERRRVVRDLHDGAQQRLVHTVITLKFARQALENGRDDAGELVTAALEHAEAGTEELRELAHGILPAVLTSGGLRAGVEALASRMPLPVDVGVTVERLPSQVEATAYFVVAEALTNVAKHASAGRAEVVARVENGTLCVDVRDDGVGGVRPDGSGIVGLGDRLAVLDGRLRVESPAGGGTRISAAIPLAPDPAA